MLAPSASSRDHPHVQIFLALSSALIAVLYLSSITMLVGAIAFHFLIWRKTPLPVGPVREAADQEMFDLVARWGLWSAAALLVLAGPRAAGVASLLDDRFPLRTRLAALVFRSEWGIGFATTICAGLCALAGFLIVRKHGRAGWMLALASVPLIAIGAGLQGHPFDAFATMTAAPIFDGIHAIGIGAWLGTFVYLVLAERRVQPHTSSPWTDPLGAMIERYFRVAGALTTLVILTGLFSATVHLTTFDDLEGTQFGQLLIGKVGIVVILLAFNEFHRRHAERQARTTERPRLVHTLRFQAGLVFLILALTAMLIDVAPPSVNEVRGEVFRTAPRGAADADANR